MKEIHFMEIMGKRFSKRNRLTDADFDHLETMTYCKADEIKSLYREFLTWSPKGDLNKAHFCLHSTIVHKGLINLALKDPQDLQEPVHVKSYRVDTLPKYTEYIFQHESGSFLLIKYCLENS